MNTRDLTIVVLVVLGALALLPVLMMTMWGVGNDGFRDVGRWRDGARMAGGAGGHRHYPPNSGEISTWDGWRLARRTSPLDIAKERYARGEIGRDEFEQLRKDLEASETHAHGADSHGGHSHGHCGH